MTPTYQGQTRPGGDALAPQSAAHTVTPTDHVHPVPAMWSSATIEALLWQSEIRAVFERSERRTP